MTTEQQQYDRICKARFDEIIDLLRGAGDKPGLVGRIDQHAEHLADIRSTLFGTPENRRDSLCQTVERLVINGASRNSADAERRHFMRSVLSKLLTAAILALAALLGSLYRGWGNNPSQAASVSQPAATGATHNPSERPPQ